MTVEARLCLLSFFILCYLVTMVLFRRHAVYLAALAWLAFPNWATGLTGLAGAPMFTYIELTGSILLSCLMVRDWRTHGGIDRDERLMIILFLVPLLFQNAIGTPLMRLITVTPMDIPEGAYLVSAVQEFSPLIFLAACATFIHTAEDMERMMMLFVLVGVALALEFLVTANVEFFSTHIGRITLDDRGRFYSLFLNDYNAVGVVSCVASICSLYFLFARKNLLYLLCTVLPMIALVANFKRSAMLALGAAALVFAYKGFFRRTGALLIPLAVIGIAFMLSVEDVIDQIAALMPSDYLVKRVYAWTSMESLLVRIGIQTKALEIILAVLPFGVGYNMLRYHFHLPVSDIFNFSNIYIYEGHTRFTANTLITEAHNGYIEYMASYGLVGLLGLGALLFFVARNYTQTRTFRDRREELLQAAVYSAMAFFFVFHIFLAYPNVYVCSMFFLHATFLLRRRALNPEAPPAAPAPTPTLRQRLASIRSWLTSRKRTNTRPGMD